MEENSLWVIEFSATNKVVIIYRQGTYEAHAREGEPTRAGHVPARSPYERGTRVLNLFPILSSG